MERAVSAADDGVLRLAMWSGPRNLSTAFMRSWENRGDTIVIDEPFYAHYLKVTGLDHPGRDEIIAHQESDWRRVTGALLAPMPSNIRVFYQKQMSHHLLPHMGREWLDSVPHALLIRDPSAMLASLGERLASFDLLATGLPQQVEIFEHVILRTGKVPAVLDSADLLERPEPMLRALCDALGVPFTGHPMIGHDIIYTHPLNSGAAVGRTAQRDFLRSIGCDVLQGYLFDRPLMVQDFEKRYLK